MKRNHRLKFLINAALILLAASTIWHHKNFPLPTLEMEMHRTEETCLADRSTVIYTYRHPYMKDARNPYAIRNQEVLVGTTMDSIHVFLLGIWGDPITWDYGRLAVFPRNTGTATLIPLPETRINSISFEFAYNHHYHSNLYAANLPHLLAVGPPTAATRARLTMDLSSRAENLVGSAAVYTAEADREGSVFLFQLERKFPLPENNTIAVTEDFFHEGTVQQKPQPQSGDLVDVCMLAEIEAFTTLIHHRQSDLYGIPYTLEFFDKDGSCISTLDVSGDAQTG